MDSKKIKGKYFPANSDRELIFIHGYTGGPDDFGDLPEISYREFSASVSCPLLPGHGTSVDRLFGMTREELYASVEQRIKNAVANRKKIILVGLSMGAQAALYFAAKYPVNGVVAVSISHDLKFPFNIPGIGLLRFVKRTWEKKFTPAEIEMRKGAIYYSQMPADGLYLTKTLRSSVNNQAHLINNPVLFVHSASNRLGNPGAIPKLSDKICGKTSARILDCSTHSMFFSNVKNQVVREVLSFIKEENLFGDRNPVHPDEKATAIIPAYNEAKRIGGVLSELLKAPSINEVIVVDDGSTDGTAERAGGFVGVTVIKNDANLGKGASLEKGVKATKNDIIFFCDADLINFKARHAEAIIEPVRNGTYDMFIGIRQNFMQRTVRAWALNSGERALRKKIWQDLPDYFKHRFRVEAGLNFHVKHFTKHGFGSKMFDYSQPIKESKYGIIWGTLLRCWMNFDVLMAYANRLFHKK